MRTFLLMSGIVWLGLASLFVLGLLRAARRKMPAPPAFNEEDSSPASHPQSHHSKATPALAD